MSETIALASKRTNEEEINCLRDHFKENIRVLENIGQLSYIIKICLDEYDASLTFQLDSSYPIKPPEIILTAPRLTPEQILSASKYLQSYSQTLIGQVMVLNIYKQLLKWFAENNIQMVRISGEKSPQILSSVTTNGTSYFSKKSNINGRRNSISEENKEKTSSMKIVDDIISRIQLDTRLKKEHFSIGYIDQFLGVQEKLFTDFNFEIDLKCLDNRCSTKLCIPKHRIQYFKYHNEIIWDKCTRTDNISDSTCGQLTLYDIIQRLPPIIKDNNSKTNDDNERVNHDSVKEEEFDDRVSELVLLTVKDCELKPNYYLSIPITDSSVIKKYLEFRQYVLDTEPTLFKHCSSFRSDLLHITLLTLRLNNQFEIDQCILTMKSLQEELKYFCTYPERLKLYFFGCETFYNKTLFINCRKHDRLENLRAILLERFKLNNINLTGNYDFIPHLSLINIKQKLKTIPLTIYKKYQQSDFGVQNVEAIQLCQIVPTDLQQKYTLKLDF